MTADGHPGPMSCVDRGLTAALLEIHSSLLLHFGDPEWWPGDTPFEISVGAVLTQNTTWKNVEMVIGDLKGRNMMSPRRICGCDGEELAELIKAAGYYNQKSGYLRNLCGFIENELEGEISSLELLPLETARMKLLDIKGIGPETADSILCYAAGQKTLVVDQYTKRILSRYLPAEMVETYERDIATCEKLRSLLMRCMEGDNQIYNRFHALIVLLGKDLCKPRPKCGSCPLAGSCRTGVSI
ncbi:MAG: endonuclease III domain-containing protein [Thermoplasmatota archaeon]